MDKIGIYCPVILDARPPYISKQSQFDRSPAPASEEIAEVLLLSRRRPSSAPLSSGHSTGHSSRFLFVVVCMYFLYFVSI